MTLTVKKLGRHWWIVGHEDAGSAAANRFKLPRGFGITIAPEMAAVFWYDPTSLRWRVM